MKTTKFLRAFAFIALLCSISVMMLSCKEDDTPAGDDLGTITGTVTDIDAGTPVAGVTVTVSELDGTATTDNDGKYTVANVSIATHSVTFTKTGWQTVSSTVAAAKFVNKVATVNASLKNASAKITGIVTDGKNNNAPLEGVTVSVGVAGSATSDASGRYTIEYLAIEDYTVTFTKPDYGTIVQEVLSADFVNSVATLNVEMGGVELLRGKTASDLEKADKWIYDFYGGNDWSYNFLGAFQFYGNFEIQSEGAAVRIRNDEPDRNNPKDENVFDSYMYGSKAITANNKILTVWVRTHNADAAAPAHFGVQVVDLSARTVVKVGDTKMHGSEDYAAYTFDLSAYIGKEVIVAIGVYRWETGDYWKQLPIRRIVFSSAASDVDAGRDWPFTGGAEVITGWKLTKETIPALPVIARKSFIGVPGVANDDKTAVFQSMREVEGHLVRYWSYMNVNKDCEPHRSEGFILKTRGGGTPLSTVLPESYIYAKFAIAAGNNRLTLKARNFSDNATFFKLTVIKEDGSVTHVAPTTSSTGSAAADNCWKFSHQGGGASDPDAYASFTYDLSAFNGNNAVLVFSVYKGEDNGDENKLCIYTMDLK